MFMFTTSPGNDSLLDFSCFEDVAAAASNGGKKSSVNYHQLQIQLQQTQQLSDWYREQCIKQEEEMARLKEQGGIFFLCKFLILQFYLQ